MRQSPNRRIYPRFRPQTKQRKTFRLENFGFLLDRAIVDFLGISKLTFLNWEPQLSKQFYSLLTILGIRGYRYL